MPPRLTGLWRHPDFVRFWAADTISIFGSLVTRVALPFIAILALDASALEVAALTIADLLPAFLIGLPVGVWVDRLHRLPILIAADIGRALLLLSVPISALFDVLTMEQLYAVAFFGSIMTISFEVAHLSFLPSIIRKDDLLEANSKLAATASVSEVSAFGVAGWLVQAFSGPGAILLDALSFIVSAVLLRDIKAKEVPPSTEDRVGVRAEIAEGIGVVVKDPVLRAIALSTLTVDFAARIFGTVISLYALEELGFKPGVLGIIYGMGGVASFLGAFGAGPLNRRLGIGPAMILAIFLGGVSLLFLPFAQGAGVVAATLLIAQQLGDGPSTIYIINEVSLRQAIAPEQALGRVNATMRFFGLGAALLGALAGGVLGELIGLRATLAVSGAGFILGAVWLIFSPVRNLRQPPVTLSDSITA